MAALSEPLHKWSLRSLKGSGRWFSNSEHWLLWWRDWAGLPELEWWLRTARNCPHMTRCPLLASSDTQRHRHTHTDIHTCTFLKVDCHVESDDIGMFEVVASFRRGLRSPCLRLTHGGFTVMTEAPGPSKPRHAHSSPGVYTLGALVRGKSHLFHEWFSHHLKPQE